MSVDEKFICKYLFYFENLNLKFEIIHLIWYHLTTEILFIIKASLVLFNVGNTCTCCNLRLIILISIQKFILIIFRQGHHVIYSMWRRGSASNELAPIKNAVRVFNQIFLNFRFGKEHHLLILLN